jgi:hypothetical protein
MHVGELTLTSQGIAEIGATTGNGRLGDFVARILGCWHTRMSRPFSHQGQAYRSCLNCGAQRKFNLGNWEMQGNFYYNQASTKQVYPVAAVRRVHN